MFKFSFLLSVLLLAGSFCKADTIDYWHVFYNAIKIKEYNQFGTVQTLTINIAAIKKDDSLTVRYFRDTPCFDCLTTLSAEIPKQGAVLSKQGKGTFNPVSVSLTDLLARKEQFGVSVFEIFYEEAIDRPNKTLLFRIKLE